MAPVATNAPCHPQRPASHGTTTGQVMAPALLPALNTPVAKARCSFGNHSLTPLTAAGSVPPWARPSAARATMKPSTVAIAPCAIAATLHNATATANPRRMPNRSSRRPETA